MAAWLSSFFSYADVSSPTLRATHAALQLSGLFGRQRQAIAHELAMRAWADALEQKMAEATCVWTSRGGRS